MSTPVKIAASFETTLANKISSSATSMTLVTGTDDAGNTLSGTFGFVIDEGTASEEFVIGSVSGTAVTSMTRGLDPQNPTTEVTALKVEHRRGATVKITDYPALGRISRLLRGDDTFDTVLKYAPGLAPSTADDLADKGYVDGVAVAGGADASTTVKGITKMSVAPASATSPIAVGDNDTRVPTQGENDGLAATTTPATTNLFMTQKDLQKGIETYAADSVGTDAYAITLAPAIASYAAGMAFRIKLGTANTGAATLNINALGAKTIKKGYNSDLATGDLLANHIIEVAYDAVNDTFQLLSPIASPVADMKVFMNAGELYTDATRNVANSFQTIEMADAASKFISGQIKVPVGATSISAIKLVIRRSNGSGGNLYMQATTDIHDYVDADAKVSDTNDIYRAYNVATIDNELGLITMNSAMYDGLTGISVDDILGVRINRDGSHASDTFNATLVVYGIMVEFA